MYKKSIFCCLLCVFVFACKKETVFTGNSGVKLMFSTDSVFFDTVFTSLGSTTAWVKVFNTGKQAVRISEIKLYGGDQSFYQLNINGRAANYLKDVELRANDSLTVLVRVNINPAAVNTPFLVADSIGFLTNGNRQLVQLTAYGQNAHFIKRQVISQPTVWDDNIPYIIYDSLTIAENQVLTIREGCRVYFHKDARLLVKGTLKVEGSLEKPVTFASDRMERIYRDEAGQWAGMHFTMGSKNNRINYAVIKNAITGIQADSLPADDTPKLLLTNSVVKNMQAAGIAAYRTAIAGFNNLIYNCGQHLIYAKDGGRYVFKQNTFANYTYFFARSLPSLSFNNDKSEAMELTLTNNIIWGSLQNEFEVNPLNATTLSMQSNLIRTTAAIPESNIRNTDPLFVSPIEGNYQLREGSPAKQQGIDLSDDAYYPYLEEDMNGEKRLFPSTLGCYNFF